MPAKFEKFFEAYCYQCHDSSTQEGSVDLENLDFTVSSNLATAELWAKVLNEINSGQMPPEDSDPIEDDHKLVFLDALSNQMVLARKILSDSGGVITLRRLNRREYQNIIEQLTGIRPDVSTLPDDQATSGFDTNGGSLFFSSDQLEEYLALARKTLELSFFPPKLKKRRVVRIEPEKKYTAHYTKVVKRMHEQIKNAKAWEAQQGGRPPSDFGFLDEYELKKRRKSASEWLPQIEQYLAAPENRTGASLILTIKDGGYTQVKFPLLKPYQPGRYEIRVRAAALKDADERFQYIEFTSGFSSAAKFLGWRKIDATLARPKVFKFSFEHSPGETNLLKITQRTHQDRGDKNLWMKTRDENGLGTLPGVWIDWAEIEGPYPVKRADAGNEILFKRPSRMKDSRYVAEVLQRFVKRAFRGKTPPRKYLAKLFDRYLQGRKSGLDLEHALIDPLSIVLASPSFLYMVETNENPKEDLLADTELAVRLSQLLWAELPDETLMALAESGRLSNPDTLKKQVDRMLANPKAERFVEGFVHQWLQMERLEMFQFNGVQYPTFDNAIRANAREEVYATFKYLLDSGLPLKNLLKSNFVVVNDVMAGYYGLPGVKGAQFRKVDLPENSPRGGLIGTAAVLAMGSDGVRTSPVERGAWVLRHLVNSPPPPAPPNVPQLSRLDGEPLTGRALQAAHQEQPQCAQCHRKIDPIGFAMEHFDAAGLWRDSETVIGIFDRPKKDRTSGIDDQGKGKGKGKRKGKGKNKQNGKQDANSKNPNGNNSNSNKGKSSGKEKKKKRRRLKPTAREFPIDPSGSLPGGDSFANFFELRDVVARHDKEFAKGLVESLIAYGLGRPFGFTDEDLANEILEKARANDYQISTIIHSLVQSKAFRSK